MPSVPSNYLVDETLIVLAHDEIVAHDKDLLAHIKMINACLECLSRLPEYHQEKNEEELAILRFAVRSFNSGASALRLARCGYHQPALSMVRDLIEIYFLLDLFARDQSSLRDWLSLPDKERSKNFKPVRVRERLDALDGHKTSQRSAAYNLAAHVSPRGHHVISPDNLTLIGPFPDKVRFRALVEELSVHLSYSTIMVYRALKSREPRALQEIEHFKKTLAQWQKRYIPR